MIAGIAIASGLDTEVGALSIAYVLNARGCRTVPSDPWNDFGPVG